MDPPAMMSDNGYHLAEIWQYPVTDSGMQRPPSFASAFADTNRDILGNDPVGSDQKSGQVGARRRREEDEPAASIKTTSNGNGNVAESVKSCSSSLLLLKFRNAENDLLEASGVWLFSTGTRLLAFFSSQVRFWFVLQTDGDGKRLKTSGGGEESDDSKAAHEPSSGKPSGKKAQPAEPPKDYIHVRARRGQATDSHSLAERARREKISERMKILQDLVPGCNKVIGKALVLDEIINYIQSLQRQVEFLSMKLEAVNTRIEPGIDVFPPKEGFQFVQQAFDTTGMAFGSQATREFSRGTSPEWLHMQLGGGFERTT